MHSQFKRAKTFIRNKKNQGCLRNQVGDSLFRLNYNLPFISFYSFFILSRFYLRISFSAKLARMLVLWLSMRMNSCAEFFM